MLDLGVTPLCELMSPLINGGCVCACMCKCVGWGGRGCMHVSLFFFLAGPTRAWVIEGLEHVYLTLAEGIAGNGIWPICISSSTRC